MTNTKQPADAADTVPSVTVYDAHTGDALDGPASRDLIRASLTERIGTGAVGAYCDLAGIWQYVRDDEMSAYAPDAVRTVYVMAAEKRPGLRPHPTKGGVLIQSAADGTEDLIRLCTRHQWASLPHPEHAPACPMCLAEAEYDEPRGRLRYAELHTRLMLGF